MKLYKFKNLNIGNKKKLRFSLIRPTLVYPLIPLYLAKTTQIKNLQKAKQTTKKDSKIQVIKLQNIRSAASINGHVKYILISAEPKNLENDL